jgi:gluconate kinase
VCVGRGRANESGGHIQLREVRESVRERMRAREREFMETTILVDGFGGVEAAAQAEEKEKGEECNLICIWRWGMHYETSVFGM